MEELEIRLSIPLDGRYLRRECPLCRRQFKIGLTDEELHQLEVEAVDSFLLEKLPDSREEAEDVTGPSAERTCPYCGQQASLEEWWTQEQVAYIRAVIENLMVDLLNQQLVRPLKRSIPTRSDGLVSFEVKINELKEREAWIPPEKDDMEEVTLPCCGRAMKVDSVWIKEKPHVVYCFFCGYPHNMCAEEG